jgi:diguanylate cyclase (GGDEF)-like protein
MPTEMSSLLDDLLAERPLRQRLLDRLEDVAGGDVQLLADPPIEREDDAVPVRVNNHHFGYLIGHDVPASRLAAHAADLARWLAVERKIAELKELAYKDDLTGAWNRRYFDKAFRSIVRHAADHRFRVTLLLFDIDDFKHFNDTYGHPAGDEILQECARLMMSVVRKHDIVARIGGDEFAVIFWDAEGPRKPNSEHPQSIRRAAARFQRAVCEHRFPKLADCAPGTLTTSGGLASFPWDGRTVEELFDVADKALLESKRQGKNAITFGNGADRICPDDLTDEDGGEPES